MAWRLDESIRRNASRENKAPDRKIPVRVFGYFACSAL